LNVMILWALLLAQQLQPNTVCVEIQSIRGVYCFEGADQIGECEKAEYGWKCRVEDVYSVPLWGSWYNPALGGINCDGENPDDPFEGCDTVATGPFEEWMYGAAASCPPGWTRYTYTTVIVTEWGEFSCVDNGPGIRPVWREVYTAEGFDWMWVIVVDFLMRQRPHWGYSVIEEWSLR